MKILVTWYRNTGKYYSSGEVEIDENYIFEEAFKQKIVDRQEVMRDGWQRSDSGYFVVTQDLDAELAEYEKSTGKTAFHWHLFKPGAFAHVYKSNSNSVL
jgi:hypothetical protein